MADIDGNLLRQVAPNQSGTRAQNQTRIISAVGPVLAQTLDDYLINSNLRVAHFVAQTCQELGPVLAPPSNMPVGRNTKAARILVTRSQGTVSDIRGAG